MKEYNIGEKIILEVEEVTENIFERCVDCYFNTNAAFYEDGCMEIPCDTFSRSDKKNVIFKEVKEQKRKMKEDKHSLKISRSCGNITLDGYPIATYSNDELKILKNLLEKVLCEVNEYIKD